MTITTKSAKSAGFKEWLDSLETIVNFNEQSFETWKAAREADPKNSKLNFFDSPFSKYIDLYFQKANALVASEQITLEDAGQLIEDYRSHPMITRFGGLLASAAINASDEETVIIEGLNLKLNLIGYDLSPNKNLVCEGIMGDILARCSKGRTFLYGSAGDHCGGGRHSHEDTRLYANSGFVNYGILGNEFDMHTNSLINLGRVGNETQGLNVALNFVRAGDEFGSYANLAINAGDAGKRFGHNSYGGIFIAVKDPQSFGDLRDARLILKEEDCKEMPRLTNYIAHLQQMFEKGRRNSYDAISAFDSLGDAPHEAITNTVIGILASYGHNRERLKGW